jgi:hypothetical protein
MSLYQKSVPSLSMSVSLFMTMFMPMLSYSVMFS